MAKHMLRETYSSPVQWSDETFNPGHLVHEILAGLIANTYEAKVGDGQKGWVRRLPDRGPEGTDIIIPGFIAVEFKLNRHGAPIRIGAFSAHINGTEWPDILEFSHKGNYWEYAPDEAAPKYAIKAMAALVLDGLLTTANLGHEPTVENSTV